MNDRVNVRRRPRRSLVNEGIRMATELASLMPAAPFLAHAPRGDGHPVLVMPGFGGGDRSTALLRAYLASVGNTTHPWGLGVNLGPAMEDLLFELQRRLAVVYTDAGKRTVSLIGWSLGGVYARLLAHLHPEMIRQVITLGSPFATHRRSARARQDRPSAGMGRWQSDRPRLLAAKPLPGIPSTAVFSKTDDIVPWQVATEPPTEIAENIEVYASHLGLGFNPAVYFALADRLATPEGGWRPFERRGWKRTVYGPARLDDGPSRGNYRARGVA